MISIIVATVNKLNYIKLFAKSLEKNTVVPYELIIWDNGSTDGTKEWCESIDCKYYRSETNIGISIPYDKMIRECKYDTFLYAENDLYMLPNWDKAIDETKERGSWRHICMIRHAPANARRPIGLEGFYGASIEEFQEEKLLSDFKNKKAQYRYYGSLGPMIMRKEDYIEMGGYNTKYMEDERDLNWKGFLNCNKYNKKMLTHPESFCYHFLQKTLRPKKMSSASDQRDKDFETKFNISMEESLKQLRLMEVAGPAYNEYGELIKYD